VPAGLLRLDFIVEKDGSVKHTRVAGDAGPYRELADRATLLLRLWKFTPARVNDGDVRSQARLTVEFYKSNPPAAAAGSYARTFERWVVDGVSDDFGAGAVRSGPGPGLTLPSVTKQVNPVYPREALKSKLPGWVRIELVILPTGAPGPMRVISSTDVQFEAAALQAAREYVFTPGTRAGEPVPFFMTVEFQFMAK